MRILYKLVALSIIGISVTAAWVWMEYQDFVQTEVALKANTSFTVERGATIKHVANALVEKGVISSARYFIWQAKLTQLAHKIKAGEYVLNAGLPSDVLAQLVEGKVKLYTMTIIDGWNVKEMLAAIDQSPHLTHTLAGLKPADIMTKLGLKGHFEGQFYPDTYHFPKGMTDAQFLLRAHRQLQKVLKEEWAGRVEGLPLKSADEALILASIVEKETGVAVERARVSGVFVNRLNKGMRLQTDPTVIYGMGDRYKGNIRRKDLREATAYNTYVIKGLPPTPIALVSKAAIHATVHPESHQYLYFVATGSGGHTFSKNLKAHNKAVKAFLKATRK
ncbi:MAG: endolytic transglycosylase MltG [Methylococcales bacterium]|jgi:UPF0755 protein|nr:endolytic transglycosylase MltG [Methylococcales bacterium]MBT7443627.1 endolytic transglycosylase MltG [Methylococcales bacterium]